MRCVTCSAQSINIKCDTANGEKLLLCVGTGYGEELSGSINAGNFLTSCKVYWLASQEGLCSME